MALFRRRKAAESSEQVEVVEVEEITDDIETADSDGADSAPEQAPPFDRAQGPFDETEGEQAG